AFEDGPDRGRILVFGRDTGGRYSLMEWTVAAGEPPPHGLPPDYGPHLHRDIEETFLIRKGRLEFLLGAAVASLGPGDFVRVPPGTRHGYANVSGAPVEMLVGFHPGGFEELFVKYRTDAGGPEPGDGFVADATALFASEFEDHP
ncbi:MAG TPA: cupin domain-containing protein, partial [Phenylobacterium sp.]|nr:cupin domain-containing protein [Phenylobacterium sp.]